MVISCACDGDNDNQVFHLHDNIAWTCYSSFFQSSFCMGCTHAQVYKEFDASLNVITEEGRIAEYSLLCE